MLYYISKLNIYYPLIKPFFNLCYSKESFICSCLARSLELCHEIQNLYTIFGVASILNFIGELILIF